MSAGNWSGVVTALLLVCFLVGVAWVWSGRRRRDFDEAARLPLQDDHVPASSKDPR